MTADKAGTRRAEPLGIVHGVSASASGLSSINVEATANVIMPMVPAFVLLMWCTIFPLWIRLGSVALAIPFGTVFYRTIAGLDFFHWTLGLAYGSLATMELLWAACLWRDFKKHDRHGVMLNGPGQADPFGQVNGRST